MKILQKYIIEKLSISNYLKPEEFTEFETLGQDKYGDKVIIIGIPFKNKKDPNWKKTSSYIHEHRFDIETDIEFHEDDKDFKDHEYWCYAIYKEYYDHSSTLHCYSYDKEGIFVKKK